MKKTFLAIYIGTENSEVHAKWKEQTEEQQAQREQAGIAGWVNWVQKHQSSIVEVGSPLGATKRVGRDGITDYKNSLTAYTVVQANSHEEAAKMFINHPHFTIFPGDSVEIMECLPLPNM